MTVYYCHLRLAGITMGYYPTKWSTWLGNIHICKCRLRSSSQSTSRLVGFRIYLKSEGNRINLGSSIKVVPNAAIRLIGVKNVPVWQNEVFRYSCSLICEMKEIKEHEQVWGQFDFHSSVTMKYSTSQWWFGISLYGACAGIRSHSIIVSCVGVVAHYLSYSRN